MFYLMIKLPFSIVIVYKTPFSDQASALDWAMRHPPFDAFSVVPYTDVQKVKRPIWVPLKKNGRCSHV
jgi:hypothetical protein